MTRRASAILIVVFSLQSFAISNDALSNESLESLSKVLRPEVVGAIYELRAKTDGHGKNHINNLAAAAVAGAAGGAAAKAVEMILERVFADKKDGCEPREIVIDDHYFDISAK